MATEATKIGSFNSHNKKSTNISYHHFVLSLSLPPSQWALNKISAPWLLLWSQLAIAVILLQLTDLVGLLEMPKLRFSVAKQLIPLIAINVLGLGVNTVCLVYVDTSFYQVNVKERNMNQTKRKEKTAMAMDLRFGVFFTSSKTHCLVRSLEAWSCRSQ